MMGACYFLGGLLAKKLFNVIACLQEHEGMRLQVVA